MKKRLKKKHTRHNIQRLYFDKVREYAYQVSRRFRRDIQSLDPAGYAALESSLESMFKTLYAKDRFFSFYYEFAFTIKELEGGDISGEFGKYLLDLMRRKNKGAFDKSTDEAGDLKNWVVFSEVRRARLKDNEAFLHTLPDFFYRNVIQKFNAEIEHTIYLTRVTLTLKRPQTKKELRGKDKRVNKKTTRRPKRVKFVSNKKKNKRRAKVKNVTRRRTIKRKK